MNIPSGPVGHMGIALALAYVLRLNIYITVLCGILPDLVDKPISAIFGIGGGRYIGHSLLFVFVVSLAFFLWKRRYGAAALVGGISHLLLDIDYVVPWFYPFKDYEYYDDEFSFAEFFKDYLSWDGMGIDIVIAAVACLIAFVGIMTYRRFRRQR